MKKTKPSQANKTKHKILKIYYNKSMKVEKHRTALGLVSSYRYIFTSGTAWLNLAWLDQGEEGKIPCCYECGARLSYPAPVSRRPWVLLGMLRYSPPSAPKSPMRLPLHARQARSLFSECCYMRVFLSSVPEREVPSFLWFSIQFKLT